MGNNITSQSTSLGSATAFDEKWIKTPVHKLLNIDFLSKEYQNLHSYEGTDAPRAILDTPILDAFHNLINILPTSYDIQIITEKVLLNAVRPGSCDLERKMRTRVALRLHIAVHRTTTVGR